MKAKIAAEHGAVGCLIYSDPKDDGYFGGAVFPNGPMRPSDGVQRGSVEDLATGSGDPLTPGIGAVPGAPRIDDARLAAHHEDPGAADFLRRRAAAARGDGRPDGAGRLARRAADSVPLAQRRRGPGAAPVEKVHLKVAFNWDQKPLWDVIAKIPGSTFPDEWIIRGNHHDGWVNGANDPISGMAPELEEARALGELRKQGWQPKRTIVYASWDGEEPGLLGSTEWVEQHEKELRDHAVAYINTRRQRPRLPQPAGLAHARAVPQRRRERHQRSRDEHQRAEAAAGLRDRSRRRPTNAKTRASGPTSASARSAPGPTTRRSSSTPASRRSTSASATKTTTGSTTRSTTTSISTRTSSTPTSRTAARSRRPSARRSSASPTPTSSPSSSRTSRTRCRSTAAS